MLVAIVLKYSIYYFVPDLIAPQRIKAEIIQLLTQRMTISFLK